jgi:hypothetical protein
MVTIESHPELYMYDSLDRVKTSLAFANNLPSIYDGKTTFHFYWRVPGPFERKQVLPIKSSIVTQNRDKVDFILWSNTDLSTNEYVKPLLPYITLKQWNLRDEVRDTPLENAGVLNGTVDDPLCYLGGDIFRLLCLYKYGGVYIDMDVAVLRDLNPLLAYEFMYQWGSSGTTKSEPDLRQNGAVMRMFAGSRLATDLLNELRNTPGNPNSTCWGTDLYKKVYQHNRNWYTFPCAWFNTEWGLGIPLQPFKKNQNGNDSSELFDGAFTWHWHNKWKDEIEPGSKFYILEQLIDERFRALNG